jgi:hypothetical protein
MPRSPSQEEAVAIAAAVERFLAETAAPGGEPAQAVGPWQRAALVEGVGAKGTAQEIEREGVARWQS